MREARHKRIHTTRFYLYEVQRQARLTDGNGNRN